MKYCEEYAALLDLFVDGELSMEEMIRVQEHLNMCPACQSYVDDALAMRAAFPDADAEEVPEGFASGVMAKIRSSGAVAPKKRKKTPWMSLVASLAACCAIVIIQQNGPMATGNTSSSAFFTADTAAAESAVCDDTGLVEEAYAEEETVAEDAVAEEGMEAPAQRNTEYTVQTAEGALAYHSESDSVTADATAPEEPAEEKAAAMWVEDENVVFSCVVFLPADRVGSVLAGYEGKPYATDEGIVGTGYAMEQAEFERILYDSFDYPHGPELNPERTTDLCCIVVTE